MRPSARPRPRACVTRLVAETDAREMLEPVLDPFHRPAGDARGDADQHDVGKHALLDAEAAAGIGRGAQRSRLPGHLQRARHHRMHAERPLEIREHVVGVLAGDRIRRRRRRFRSACRSCADSGWNRHASARPPRTRAPGRRSGTSGRSRYCRRALVQRRRFGSSAASGSTTAGSGS